MQGKYVLVVDDDPDAQEILSRIVESLGLESQIATDGLEALSLIYSRQPNLVLLDLMMPRLDGFGVLSRLNSNPKTRGIPVIVVTACRSDQIDMLKLPGVTQVVQKGDFSPRSFCDLLSKTLHIH